jgi:uncharacterized membrane protein
LTENSIQKSNSSAIAFRWGYLILPLAILVIIIILTACFYTSLPAEVSYHYQPDGLPDKFIDRGMLILWTLLPQILLTLAAAGITWITARLFGQHIESESSYMNPDVLLKIIGNMVSMPQIILLLATLDIFLYNLNQVHLLPVWSMVLIVLGLGGIILSIFFIRAMIQAWKANR